MPTKFAKDVFDSRPFFRTKEELTYMARKDVILPITQFGEGNLGVDDIDTALGDCFTSNMKSNSCENILIAIPVTTYDETIPEACVVLD